MERERERVFTFLCEQNMDWMEEKMRRKKVKIKERWREGKILRLRYRVMGRYKWINKEILENV